MLKGRIVFLKTNFGSKSEGQFPFLVLEDGETVKILLENENPFENNALREYEGKLVEAEGEFNENGTFIAISVDDPGDAISGEEANAAKDSVICGDEAGTVDDGVVIGAESDGVIVGEKVSCGEIIGAESETTEDVAKEIIAENEEVAESNTENQTEEN